MQVTVFEADVFGKTITIETGRMAKQADGSVIVRCGDTMVLVTAVCDKDPREGADFLPLTCDYQEKTYSAGKIPGGFFKREGRPSEKEILTSRLIDRPVRPRFPKGFNHELQIVAGLLSKDDTHEGDVLGITGASTALHISHAPFDGPISAVRVGYVGGKFIANPTHQEMPESEMDLIVAASRDAIVMVEGECQFVPEDRLTKALMFGFQACQPLNDVQDKLREAVGVEKMVFTPKELPADLVSAVQDAVGERLLAALTVKDKAGRRNALRALRDEVFETLNEGHAEESLIPKKDFREVYDRLKSDTARNLVLSKRVRIDGRQPDEVRLLTMEVALLPRTHGSALFTRGETQALVTTTLGTSSDEQKIDGLLDEEWRTFLLHYNFPPFSVGEVRFLRGPGRREIGHGNLARRALAPVLPSEEDFPYTVRLVSDVLESNGSSSMATVCGGSLALMDAGVPITEAVAGVAMGLIKGEGDDFVVLTDILGDEDHMGDMDFKVTGTKDGITAIQMDIKVSGINEEVFTKALEQARVARLHILEGMNAVLAKSRPDLAPHAPRITTVMISTDKIRDIIGPGGKTIRRIVEETGVKIDVEDDGRVLIASTDGAAAEKAVQIIRELTAEPEEGKFYVGRVVRIEAYGAFVQIFPGVDGMIHISQLEERRVERVEDVINLGDEVLVQVIEIDKERGRVRLSRKAALGLDPADVVEQL
ncbi:MAG: polyribonucleotide nucleotidyltransferase [Candidatus Lernaella stagnicola]|nr:polyribonucleotide nucleotidyltransferase [Candidatus Lernaella stagnicola]